MNSGDTEFRYVNVLRNQGNKPEALSGALPCPFPGHQGRIFQHINQLVDHAKTEHSSEIEGLEPRQARAFLKEAASRLR